ncbi:MAG TPA: 2-oxo acid dehydrogenase subunit E2 [Candidatus Binatia bacterium]|jgi:pyruvate dehydrogenase E2 component (dihydrolipoamide acetyltransferase)
MADDRPQFRRADRLSSWRRLAVHVWKTPADPTVYGVLEVDMRRSLEYLAALNSSPDGGARVTATHLVVKAIAKAIAETPDSNAMIARGQVWVRDSIDIYCQVATDEGRDLSGVKIRHANRKSPAEVADELTAAAAAVRAGRDRGSEATKQALGRIPDFLLRPLLRLMSFLTFDLRLDLERFGIAYDQFGSAMVSNVGGFGLHNGLAPLVPISRSPIVLLVGQITDRPIVEHGKVIAAPVLNIGATFDHRIIDGYQGAMMARTVIDAVKDPERAFGPALRPSRSS